METIEKRVHQQQIYFQKGSTRSYSFRKQQLVALKKMINNHEQAIYDALKSDLNKSSHETFTTELGLLYTEIDVALKNLRKWMERKQVQTPLTHKGTKSYLYKEPYGVTLIISPWNYPLQLALAPAIGAIAAGNCVVIKPSEYAEATSSLLATMIEKTFVQSYITVVEGAKEISQKLLDQPFDYIFFTGSTAVGKEIMKSASNHLTPVTLELGGKSPAIIDQDANIKLAAKRIVWGKFTNAGQTCVAPDFLYVHEKVKKELIKAMKKYIKSFYGKKPLENKDYVHIIHEKHFNRLKGFLSQGKIIHGGETCEDHLIIEPTLLDHVSWEETIMQEEIFGPLLPMLTFTSLDDVLEEMKPMDKPLALYYFGNHKKKQEKVIQNISFGGGCMNDTLYHLANPHLPFGGVGSSGMGHYHGQYSFDTFSHQKSILEQTNRFDMPLRYPGSKLAHMFVKKIMK